MLILDGDKRIDGESEEQIIRNIEYELNLTIISIAHRTTTLKNCDKIFVIEIGKVISEGTYDVLNKTSLATKTELSEKNIIARSSGLNVDLITKSKSIICFRCHFRLNYPTKKTNVNSGPTTFLISNHLKRQNFYVDYVFEKAE